MSRLVTLNIPIPQSVTNRLNLVSQYAAQYVRHNSVHETAREFAERVAGDWKDKTLRLDVMREIRRQQRTRVTV